MNFGHVLRIAITSGEPAGIGPDLLVELAEEPFDHELIAIGDPKLFKARAKHLHKKIQIEKFNPTALPKPKTAGILTILPVPLLASCIPGQLNIQNASYVLECLKQGATGCLEKTFDALVTGPVQKSIFYKANIAFVGQTEFLAKLCKTRDVVMMLVSPMMRVALATTHLPLRKVASAIKQHKLQKTIEILHQTLEIYLGISHPRIHVCGLNPHAGEDGTLGREEIEIIKPVIAICQKIGISVSGPYPADTLFTQKYLKATDVVLVMYHDQGLPVLKCKGFGQAVNVTLGLPIIRTSVDHGTALELAGTGKASSSSLRQALRLSINMVVNRYAF